MNLHFLENKDGIVVAVAKTKAELPKVKGTTYTTAEMNKGQEAMIKDGLPLACFYTQKQRDAHWKKNPPKAIAMSVIDNAREVELKRQREAIMEQERREVERRKPKKKALPPAEKIDMSRMRWDPNKCRFIEDKFMAMVKPVKAEVTKSKAKADITKIEQQFNVKEGSFREALLRALVKNMKKITSIEDLAKEVYGSKKKASACIMVMKGLYMTIEKNNLPWGIDKSDQGYQLHEA